MNKHARRRAKLRSAGRCPICGKIPEDGYKLCERCRKKRRALNLRSYYRNREQDHKTALFLGALKAATSPGTTPTSADETPKN